MLDAGDIGYRKSETDRIVILRFLYRTPDIGCPAPPVPFQISKAGRDPIPNPMFLGIRCPSVFFRTLRTLRRGAPGERRSEQWSIACAIRPQLAFIQYKLSNVKRFRRKLLVR